MVAAFKRAVPCPDPAVADRSRGACPGFEVDHIVPLCAGGPDAIENLQWLWDVEHDEIKTPGDLARCAALRALKAAPASPRR